MNILQDAKQAFPATNLLDLSENYRLMEFHKRIFRAIHHGRGQKQQDCMRKV